MGSLVKSTPGQQISPDIWCTGEKTKILRYWYYGNSKKEEHLSRKFLSKEIRKKNAFILHRSNCNAMQWIVDNFYKSKILPQNYRNVVFHKNAGNSLVDDWMEAVTNQRPSHAYCKRWLNGGCVTNHMQNRAAIEMQTMKGNRLPESSWWGLRQKCLAWRVRAKYNRVEMGKT